MQRFMSSFLLLALLALIQAPVQAQHTKDSLEVVKKRIKEKKAILIDVREQREWDAGHLKKAQLVPLSKLQADVKKKMLPKDSD